MNTEVQSLDDLVSLLTQGKAHFDDVNFAQAAAAYRRQHPSGKASRRQVNLAACLYLQAKGEQVTFPRVLELGGWGQRNVMLSDIADFMRHGDRPSTTSSPAEALRVSGMPARSVMEAALSHGIAAAEKILEENLRSEYEARTTRAIEAAEQRVQAADQRAAKANELKESAQAQARLLEQRYDALLAEREQLQQKTAAAVARSEELVHQVQALSRALTEAGSRAQEASNRLGDTEAQLVSLQAKQEADRKSHMLALDGARHANDESLAKLTSMLSQAQTDREGALARSTAAEGSVGRLNSEKTALQNELSLCQSVAASLAGMEKSLSTSLEAISGKVTELMGSTAEPIMSALEELQTIVRTLKPPEEQL